MSTIRGSALPVPWGAPDETPIKPTVILTAILRSPRALGELRRLDRAVPARPSCRPAVPTFFPFDVRDFIDEGCARQRNDRRSR